MNAQSPNEAQAQVSITEPLPAITGARFLAALAVASFHIPFTLTGVTTAQFFQFGGVAGVSFFFVLSGFILAHANPSLDRLGCLKLREFYVKRIARIYPLHLALFLVWIYLNFKTWGVPVNEKLISGIANGLLLHAFFVGDVYTLGYNAVSWTLSVEAFLYLLFPLIATVRRAAAVIVAHVSIVLLLMAFDWDVTSVISSFYYFNPISRLAEFSSGILAYALVRRWFGNASSLAANTFEIIALALVVISASIYLWLPAGLRYPFIGVSFSVMIAALSLNAGFIAKLLSSRVFVLLGESSFAFYMIHHMWFVMVQSWAGGRISGLPLGVLAFASAIFLSVVIFTVFERPVRDWVINAFREK